MRRWLPLLLFPFTLLRDIIQSENRGREIRRRTEWLPTTPQGVYGMVAVEAMALGKVVVGSVDPMYYLRSFLFLVNRVRGLDPFSLRVFVWLAEAYARESSWRTVSKRLLCV